MKWFLVNAFCLTLLCFVAIHCSPKIVPRISRGKTVKATKYPSEAYITNEETRLLCGATLISSQWILTVAHCVTPKRRQVGNPMKHRITFGRQNRAEEEKFRVDRGVESYVLHPQLEYKTYSHDIALIKLNESIDFEKYPYLKPMCLDLCGMDMNTMDCYATGFGSLHNYNDNPEELQELQMKPFDHQKCAEIHRKFYESQEIKEAVTNLQFCMVSTAPPLNKTDTSSGGVCPGDSGGPLQCRYKNALFQTGVTWSITDCETQPSVFQNVAKYREFIVRNTNYELPAYCPPNPACQKR